jgi:hypothetical protein
MIWGSQLRFQAFIDVSRPMASSREAEQERFGAGYGAKGRPPP